MDVALARARMKSLALAAVGLGAANPAPYLALIGPDESAAMRASMLTMSGCGLVVRGLWREFGMRDPRLFPPYELASVMTTIESMATEAGAWSAGAAGLSSLDVGDVVYVSQPDHVGTIVSIARPGDGSVHVTTVDGGSLDANGKQRVVTYQRTFAANGDVTAGPMAGTGRVMVGTVSLPPMALRFGGAGDSSAPVIADTSPSPVAVMVAIGAGALGGYFASRWLHNQI
jgi:hypothetical protein